MARPSDADSAKTIEAILGAATELLADSPDPPSLRAIAAAAGLSVGTLQYYFPTREELFEACLDAYYDRLTAQARPLLAMNGPVEDPGAVIEEAAKALFRWARSERALVSLRQAMNASRGELHPRRQRDVMGGFIEEASKSLSSIAHVSELDVRLSVQALATMITRFALMTDSELGWLTGLGPEEGRAVLEAFVARAARRLIRPDDTLPI